VANYKKQPYLCTVEAGEDGKLAFMYDGQSYNSPSSAGTAVIGTACNGWRFWSIEGDAAAVADPEDRDQRQGKLAAATATFDFTVDNRTVTVHSQNLDRLRVNYYRMDLELLFSRQPFVQQQADRFGFIMPNRSDEVSLAKAMEMDAELRKVLLDHGGHAFTALVTGIGDDAELDGPPSRTDE
jgi:hypothetical protein